MLKMVREEGTRTLTAIANFFVENWGSLASLAGILVTLFFSYGAKKAARAAEQAAKDARSRLINLDYFSELQRLISLSDELYNFLEQNEWRLVSDRASALRNSAAVISSADGIYFSEETRERLRVAAVQFKNIAAGADRAADPNQATPDHLRYRRIVADQKESFSLAAEELKRILGERDV